MNKITEKLRFLMSKGLFHIFGTNVINSGISFITNILIVKFLSKSSYGVYSYANNALSIFLLFTGLGITNGLLQFCSEKRDSDEKNSFFKFGFIVGLMFNTGMVLVIYLYGSYASIAIEESAVYIRMLMFLPIFELAYGLLTIILRVYKENKKYSYLLNFNTVAYATLSCLGAYMNNIAGAIVGRYIAYSFSIVIGCLLCRGKIKEIIRSSRLTRSNRKTLIKYSSTCCASNSISQLLYLLDVYLIGIYVIDSAAVASYKVATLIPSALTFIPSGIMVFIYPYFAEHNKDNKWIRTNVFKMLKILSVINLCISVGLFVCAPLIIKILWGESYLDSVVPLRILAVNYFFLSTIRIPMGNILSMLRRVNYNLLVSVLTGVANIVLDIILIKKYGANGAAVATFLVVLISAILLGGYLFIVIYKKPEINKRGQE